MMAEGNMPACSRRFVHLLLSSGGEGGEGAGAASGGLSCADIAVVAADGEALMV